MNTQKSEAPVRLTDGFIDVHSIFYTIQGEGPFAGCPAVFVRLAGCNLKCLNCDTDYTSQREVMSSHDLVTRIFEAWMGAAKESAAATPKGRWPVIVFTGGEPFRQDFGPAVRELVQEGFEKIQVETNGTLFVEEFPWLAVTIVCSPKLSNMDGRIRSYVKHLKYVLNWREVSLEDGLPTSVLGKATVPARPWEGFTGTVWVQPEDCGDAVLNKVNLDKCVEVAKKFGYRVSIQSHKIMGVP